MGWHPEGSKYHGWTSDREEDQNAYRLGMRDGIFGYWMTRAGQINETVSTRTNYFRGFIDGIAFSKDKTAKSLGRDERLSNDSTGKAE